MQSQDTDDLSDTEEKQQQAMMLSSAVNYAKLWYECPCTFVTAEY